MTDKNKNKNPDTHGALNGSEIILYNTFIKQKSFGVKLEVSCRHSVIYGQQSIWNAHFAVPIHYHFLVQNAGKPWLKILPLSRYSFLDKNVSLKD